MIFYKYLDTKTNIIENTMALNNIFLYVSVSVAEGKNLLVILNT